MEWNKVEDGLPELNNPKDIHSQWCLMFRQHPPIYYVAYCTRDNEWRDGYGKVIEGATHWMPLPSPPSEREV